MKLCTKKNERFALNSLSFFFLFFFNNDRLIEQEKERITHAHTRHHVEGSASSEGFDESIVSSEFELVSVGTVTVGSSF